VKTTIVIPAHNEGERITGTLEKYLEFFRNKENLDVDFLIVLNGCKDNTLEVVKRFSKYKELSYIEFEQKGKGFAVVQGFKEALKRGSDLIGFVDADMSTLPKDYCDLIENIGNYDGIIASRWEKNSKIIGRSRLRTITSKGFNILARAILLIPYKDTQCGAKVFKKEAISQVINEIGNSEWGFDIELLYRMRKHKFRIKEFATVWEEKKGSKLKLLKTPVRMFSGIMRLRLMNSPFKFIVRAYDLLPEKIKIHHNQ
jgi:glycosyltransferase involved in cell wall biosynthesis